MGALTCSSCRTEFDPGDDVERFAANALESQQLGVPEGTIVCPMCWHEYLWPHLISEFSSAEDEFDGC